MLSSSFVILLKAKVTISKCFVICHPWAITKAFGPELWLRFKKRVTDKGFHENSVEGAALHPVLGLPLCQCSWP